MYAGTHQSCNFEGSGIQANVAGRDINHHEHHHYHYDPVHAPAPQRAGKPKRRLPGWVTRSVVTCALAVGTGVPIGLSGWWQPEVEPGTASTSLRAGAPPSPPSEWPAGTSALCNNGEFSPSHTRSGTCSGKDGVAFWRYPSDHPYWRLGGEA